MTNNQFIEIETVEPGTEVTLKFTDVHYKRLQQLLFNGLPFKDLNHLTEIAKQIKVEDYSKDPLAYHTATILSIMHDFEKAVKEQGKFKKQLFDPATQKVL